MGLAGETTATVLAGSMTQGPAGCSHGFENVENNSSAFVAYVTKRRDSMRCSPSQSTVSTFDEQPNSVR